MVVIWTIILRLYRGRDINKFSRPLTWATGTIVGATSWGFDASWGQMVYGAAIGALATWCIVWTYKNTPEGWRNYKSMLIRTTPAAGIPVVVVAASLLGLQVGPFEAVCVPVMCLIANLTQIPWRRLQQSVETWTKQPWYGKYMAHIAEGYEAMWVGSAIVLIRVFS